MSVACHHMWQTVWWDRTRRTSSPLWAPLGIGMEASGSRWPKVPDPAPLKHASYTLGYSGFQLRPKVTEEAGKTGKWTAAESDGSGEDKLIKRRRQGTPVLGKWELQLPRPVRGLAGFIPESLSDTRDLGLLSQPSADDPRGLGCSVGLGSTVRIYHSDASESAGNLPLHLVKLNSNHIKLLKLGNVKANHCHVTKLGLGDQEKPRDQSKEKILSRHSCCFQFSTKFPSRCKMQTPSANVHARLRPALASPSLAPTSLPRHADPFSPQVLRNVHVQWLFVPIILDKWKNKITGFEVAEHRISSIGCLIS